MATVYANIGSNLGDRQKNIETALKKIEHEFGSCRKSNMVESAPWGFDSTNNFINIGVAFETGLTPVEVLKILQKIEKEISLDSHRDSCGRYIDRLIDIDIMAIDDRVVKTKELTLPHPHLFKRSFFLTPLKELAINIKIDEKNEKIVVK